MSKVSDAFDLSGRVAVVTGAARGIGAATSALLAEAGATVVCADIDEHGARNTAAAVKAGGGLATGVALDVTQRAQHEALVDQVVEKHGRLDVYVNNAAIIIDKSILDTSEEDLDRVHAVNFKGVFFGCQAAGRVMVAQRRGSIINLASGAIDLATPNLVHYATAKVAVAHLSRTFAAEIGSFGVRVNAVAPGWIDTPMNERHVLNDDGSINRERKADYVAQRSRMSVLGIPGEPDDIAFAILYLASDAAKFVTGIVMRPNGGSTMPM